MNRVVIISKLDHTQESILIPYLARFSVFYRENFPRAWMNTIRVYCMTDDKAEKTIRYMEHIERDQVTSVNISDICKASGLSPSPRTLRSPTGQGWR